MYKKCGWVHHTARSLCVCGSDHQQ